MTTTFRTAGAWGAGSGADLTPAQVDNNFYDKETRITALEAAGVGVGIASIEVPTGGNQMYITLTDSSIQGPFTLPTTTITPKGEWTPATFYEANDIVTNGGSVYLVNVDHTSDSVFDPGATATFAGDFYSLIWAFPSSPVVERTGATFTPQLIDANTYNRMTNVSGCVVTIDDDASVNFPVNTELHFRDVSEDTGAAVIIEAVSGVTINGVTGFLEQTAGSGATVTLKKVAANEWDLFGLLAAV